MFALLARYDVRSYLQIILIELKLVSVGRNKLFEWSFEIISCVNCDPMNDKDSNIVSGLL